MVLRKDSSSKPAGRSSNGTRISDPRFESIQKSSLYRRLSNKKTRVTLDRRFAPMLTDERFSSKAKVDRYGRKLRTTKDSKDGKTNVELSKLYQLEDQEQEVDGVDGDDEIQAELSRVNNKLKDKSYDPARDGGFDESSSSEEESEEESEVEEETEGDMAVLPANEDSTEAVPQGEVTRRLAVVNLDWDHIRAVDLLAVFNSYASAGGNSDRVEKVAIYPSEFGKERMEQEEMEGPPKELFANKRAARTEAEDASMDGSAEEAETSEEDNEEDDDDDDEDERIRKSLVKEDRGEEVSSTKLRSYQLERLCYFYAVVTCSSPEVAKEIYDNVDGREYLSSANFFDLRFIPDELDFSDDKPREECSKLPSKYQPNEFVTAALQHSKVKLTWDAEDTQRKDVQQRAFSGSRKDLDENELRAYLASDNSSEDEEEEVVEIVDSTAGAASAQATSHAAKPNISKSELRRLEMRKKLGLTDEPMVAKDKAIPVGDMQITFAPGLSASEKKDSVFENEPEIEETTAERYIRKERERKARRKEKLRAERSGDKDEALPVETEESQMDAGFEDPFFTATPAQAEALTAQKKADKMKQKRAQRAAEEKAAAAQAAELESILKYNTTANANTEVSHFSLSALEKAEKALRRQKLKKGKGRLSQSEKAALEAKANDDFEMDVEDKRFAAVYERPEFALDPSHPRFRDTEGMKSLLQEARERRKRDIEEDEEGEDKARSKKSRR